MPHCLGGEAPNWSSSHLLTVVLARSESPGWLVKLSITKLFAAGDSDKLMGNGEGRHSAFQGWEPAVWESSPGDSEITSSISSHAHLSQDSHCPTLLPPMMACATWVPPFWGLLTLLVFSCTPLLCRCILLHFMPFLLGNLTLMVVHLGLSWKLLDCYWGSINPPELPM